MRKRSIGAVGACMVLLATGCATSGDMKKLETRLDGIEQRLSETERKAAAAEASAERAAADARMAAQNTERSEAMFKKSVTK
jgi:uncharacterized lipoprotein YehR (DUF1307 family)